MYKKPEIETETLKTNRSIMQIQLSSESAPEPAPERRPASGDPY